SYYQIECNPALDRDMLANLNEWIFPAPFVRTRNNRAKLPQDISDSEPFLIDYERERERRNAFFEALENLRQTMKQAERGKGAALHEQLSVPPPHQHWEILRAINTPTTLTGYNNLIERWYELQPQPGPALLLLCDLFSQIPNDIGEAREKWRHLAQEHGWNAATDATANQLYNPSQGKGINKAKPNSASAGNVKNFWMLEWLK